MHTQLRFYLSLQRILHELKSTICLKSQQFRWLQTAAHIPIFLENTQPAASKALIFTITHFHTLLLLLSLFLPLLPVPLFLSLRHVCYFPLPANFLPWMLTTQVENVLEMGEQRKEESYNERRATLACSYKTTLCVTNIIIQVQCVQLFTRPFNISKFKR